MILVLNPLQVREVADDSDDELAESNILSDRLPNVILAKDFSIPVKRPDEIIEL